MSWNQYNQRNCSINNNKHFFFTMLPTCWENICWSLTIDKLIGNTNLLHRYVCIILMAKFNIIAFPQILFKRLWRYKTFSFWEKYLGFPCYFLDVVGKIIQTNDLELRNQHMTLQNWHHNGVIVLISPK